MEYEYFEVHVKYKTDRAALLEELESGNEFWVPLSLIEDPDSLEVGEELEVGITQWFLEKEGLI